MDDYNANGSGPQTPDSDETIVYDFEPITSNRQRLILSQPRPVGHEMDQGGPTLPTTQHASLSAQRNMSEGELVARAMNGDGLNLQITEDASLGTQRGMLEYAAELAQGLIAFQQGGSSLLRTQDASLGAQQNIPGAETEPAQRSGDRATGRPAQELTMQEKADIMQDWKEADDEKKGLLQVCKQWYFRNADLTTGDVRTIVDEDEFPPNSYQFDIIVKHVKIWRAEFQRKIWGQPWFLQFVSSSLTRNKCGVMQLILYRSTTKSASTTQV